MDSVSRRNDGGGLFLRCQSGALHAQAEQQYETLLTQIAVTAVIEQISTLQGDMPANITPQAQGVEHDGAIEQLQVLAVTQFLGGVNGDLARTQTLLPEPQRDTDTDQ